MDIQQAKADYLGIHLNCHFTGFEGNMMICTDQYRLQQVVLNLQSNALKFTSRNGRVDIRCKKDNGNISVEVSDNGTGIKKEDIPKLF